ncbi:transposase [Paeniglutamicibacter gangotriensis]|uniref:Transposase n=1 Tax=Paeniglutamicibacter gangotriensis TaxID=254787 RepID=A0A5B0E3A7_9MICC|nr:transposase [Paeniglutamicibacter gangotriensis]
MQTSDACAPSAFRQRWLATREPAQTLEELDTDLQLFARTYNTERPHRALDRLAPDQAYTAIPKAGPQGRRAGTHHRVRTDKFDASGKVSLRHHGRLLHLGVGLEARSRL